jgi:hypothetical protein
MTHGRICEWQKLLEKMSVKLGLVRLINVTCVQNDQSDQRARDNRRIGTDKTILEAGIIGGSKQCKNDLRLK